MSRKWNPLRHHISGFQDPTSTSPSPQPPHRGSIYWNVTISFIGSTTWHSISLKLCFAGFDTHAKSFVLESTLSLAMLIDFLLEEGNITWLILAHMAFLLFEKNTRCFMVVCLAHLSFLNLASLDILNLVILSLSLSRTRLHYHKHLRIMPRTSVFNRKHKSFSI